MACQSPSKFATIDHDDVVAASNSLQLACYSCLDPSQSRDQVYRRIVDANSLVSTVMDSLVKLRRSTHKEAEYLQNEVDETDKRCEKLQKQLKDIQAQQQFRQDEVSHGKMMAVALEVELLNDDKEAKVCSWKDLVKEVVLDEVDVDVSSSSDDTDLVLE